MNIQEAVQLGKDQDSWFRPVSWRGSGLGVEVVGNSLFVSPNPTGRCQEYVPTYQELVGEWEVIEPDFVLDKRFNV